MRPDAKVLALRVALVGGAMTVLALFLVSQPETRLYAFGAPLFALGLVVHLAGRLLDRGLLVACTLVGLPLAAAGGGLLLVADPEARWPLVLLAALGVAGLLRIPALLGPRAPRAVRALAGREVPLLALAGVLTAWAVGRPLASGADVLLADWMATMAALLALVVALVPRGVPTWSRSPGRRHEQRIRLRADPRADEWRARVARFLDTGAEAEAYAAAWRRVLLRAGVPPPDVDAALAEALDKRRFGATRAREVARRRALHERLVRTLRERSRGQTHARLPSL